MNLMYTEHVSKNTPTEEVPRNTDRLTYWRNASFFFLKDIFKIFHLPEADTSSKHDGYKVILHQRVVTAAQSYGLS